MIYLKSYHVSFFAFWKVLLNDCVRLIWLRTCIAPLIFRKPIRQTSKRKKKIMPTNMNLNINMNVSASPLFGCDLCTSLCCVCVAAEAIRLHSSQLLCSAVPYIFWHSLTAFMTATLMGCRSRLHLFIHHLDLLLSMLQCFTQAKMCVGGVQPALSRLV